MSEKISTSLRQLADLLDENFDAHWKGVLKELRRETKRLKLAEPPGKGTCLTVFEGKICGKPAWSRGMCRTCYAIYKRNGGKFPSEIPCK